MGNTWTDQEIRRWFGHFIHGYLSRRDPEDGWDFVDHAPMGEWGCPVGHSASPVSLDHDHLDVTQISDQAAVVRGLCTLKENWTPRGRERLLRLTAVLSWMDGRFRAQHLHVSHPRGRHLEELTRLRTLVGQLPGFAYRCHLDLIWRLEHLDGRFQELTGYLPRDWVGASDQCFGELAHPDFREPLRAQWREALMLGTAFQSEYPILCADGTSRWVWEQGQGVLDEQGKPSHLEVFVTDITERKQIEHSRLELERRLMQSEKLESLGVLAGGVAHDFNNLLMAMVGNLDLLTLQLPQDSPCRGSIERCMAAAQKATRLTGQMLACSGTRPACSKPVELSSLLEENESLLREVVPPQVRLILEGRKRLRPVMGDASQLLQIALTLVTNAVEAIGAQSGVVNVRCYERYLRGDDLAKSLIEATPREGWYVLLEVEDTGCGMSPEIQNRLLDPFFTTKFFGRGLGLPAAMGIIRGHQGAVLLDSELDRGTLVQVLLPVAGNRVSQ
ncbi:two-component system sensor histidine kinase NtrB [Holophaga foetida]|uniref:two-component system sensor histidine kinase NtrB n=1 Tax=Holophaga foetida TaxID=35839 RepID=UPI0002471788|nr:ATP-binding protein [Holophaga foetida]